MKKMVHNFKFIEVAEKYVNEIKAVVYSTFVFLNIDTDIVQILIYLMCLDTLFGFTKAIVMKENVSFGRMFYGFTTKILVLLIPMTLALVGKGLKGYDFTPFVEIVLKVLVVSEGISIVTNMYVIKTKKAVKNVDFVSMLLNSIRKGLTNLLKRWLGEIENPK